MSQIVLWVAALHGVPILLAALTRNRIITTLVAIVMAGIAVAVGRGAYTVVDLGAVVIVYAWCVSVLVPSLKLKAIAGHQRAEKDAHKTTTSQAHPELVDLIVGTTDVGDKLAKWFGITFLVLILIGIAALRFA